MGKTGNRPAPVRFTVHTLCKIVLCRMFYPYRDSILYVHRRIYGQPLQNERHCQRPKMVVSHSDWIAQWSVCSLLRGRA